MGKVEAAVDGSVEAVLADAVLDVEAPATTGPDRLRQLRQLESSGYGNMHAHIGGQQQQHLEEENTPGSLPRCDA